MSIVQTAISLIGGLGIVVFVWGVAENYIAYSHDDLTAKARKIMKRGAMIFAFGLALHIIASFFA